MNHWLAALERMVAYEARMHKSHRGTPKGHKTGLRGIESDAKNSGLEQYLEAGLTERGEKVWSKYSLYTW